MKDKRKPRSISVTSTSTTLSLNAHQSVSIMLSPAIFLLKAINYGNLNGCRTTQAVTRSNCKLNQFKNQKTQSKPPFACSYQIKEIRQWMSQNLDGGGRNNTTMFYATTTTKYLQINNKIHTSHEQTSNSNYAIQLRQQRACDRNV